jgi:hypothetical protein
MNVGYQDIERAYGRCVLEARSTFLVWECEHVHGEPERRSIFCLYIKTSECTFSTVIALPINSVALRAVTAASASSRDSMVTKPNPRDSRV